MYYVTNKNISSEFEMLSVGCPNSILAASHSHNQYMRWIDYHPHFENCCLATGDYNSISTVDLYNKAKKMSLISHNLSLFPSLSFFSFLLPPPPQTPGGMG